MILSVCTTAPSSVIDPAFTSASASSSWSLEYVLSHILDSPTRFGYRHPTCHAFQIFFTIRRGGPAYRGVWYARYDGRGVRVGVAGEG